MADGELQKAENDLEAEYNRRLTAWTKANPDAGQSDIEANAQGLRAEIEGRKRAAEAQYNAARQLAADVYNANLAAIGGGAQTPAPQAALPAQPPAQPSTKPAAPFTPPAQDTAKVPVGKFAHYSDNSVWQKQANGKMVRVK